MKVVWDHWLTRVSRWSIRASWSWWWSVRWRRWLSVFLVILGLFSYLTNPFVRWSIVTDPYARVVYENGKFDLEVDSELVLRDDVLWRNLALLKSGWYIVSSKVSGGPKAKSTSVDAIIAEIHAKRFDPKEPFLISGDHFSVLYPRSLGIFYHSLLDPRTALSEKDWRNREAIYLKTLAYALQVFDQSDRLSTTIVPVGTRSVALMNIYAPPSDTLYSLLYALRVTQDNSVIWKQYGGDVDFNPEDQGYVLETGEASWLLQEMYGDSLLHHWERFLEYGYDEETGLVRTDVRLSGTKDIVKKQSGFYDNVMVWATGKVGMDLGIIPEDRDWLDGLKQRILEAFWDEKRGIFIEDLSDEAIAESWYSSDWLIAYQTGFLDPRNPEDVAYLVRSVEYIQRNAIDQPFGLQYNPDENRGRAYFFVRWTANEYASSAIWSHWGMEYIKLLVDLAEVTENRRYYEQADRQLEAYTFNIKRYRGYPEVYDDEGDFFRRRFYKSIRQTGWVVNYEQARNMVEAAGNELGGGELVR